MNKHIIMKNIALWVIIISAIISCMKDKGNDDDSLIIDVFPPRVWQISFIFADEDGKNLLTYPLQSNPIANPASFRAYYGNSDNIGEITHNHRDGYTFWIAELREKLLQSETYLQDSTFVFYACFGSVCDTIVAYPDFDAHPSFCSAKKVLWNGNHLGFYWNEHDRIGIVVGKDSSLTYSCMVVPILPSISHLF